MIWNKVYYYFSLLLTFKYATAYANRSEYSVFDAPGINSRNQDLTYATNTLVRSVDTSAVGSACGCPKPSYIIGQQKVTWEVASVLCQQAGMDLASPSSEEEENALEAKWAASETTLLPGYPDGIWIGGKRCSGCLSDFYWEATGKPVVYSKYLPGQPDNYQNKENCLQLAIPTQPNTAKIGWNDFPCDGYKLKYACQSRCCCSANN